MEEKSMATFDHILHCKLTTVLIFCSVWLGMNVFLIGLGGVRAGELKPLYPGYPEVFDQRGTLEIMRVDQLVVNDATLQLLPAVTYHTPKGSVGQSGIAIGSKVGLLLTEERGVKSVWFLEAGDPGTGQGMAAEGNSRKDTPLRLENGVWKN